MRKKLIFILLKLIRVKKMLQFDLSSIKRTIILGEDLIIEFTNGKQLELNNVSFDNFLKILNCKKYKLNKK